MVCIHATDIYEIIYKPENGIKPIKSDQNPQRIHDQTARAFEAEGLCLCLSPQFSSTCFPCRLGATSSPTWTPNIYPTTALNAHSVCIANANCR